MFYLPNNRLDCVYNVYFNRFPVNLLLLIFLVLIKIVLRIVEALVVEKKTKLNVKTETNGPLDCIE